MFLPHSTAGKVVGRLTVILNVGAAAILAARWLQMSSGWCAVLLSAACALALVTALVPMLVPAARSNAPHRLGRRRRPGWRPEPNGGAGTRAGSP